VRERQRTRFGSAQGRLYNLLADGIRQEVAKVVGDCAHGDGATRRAFKAHGHELVVLFCAAVVAA